MTVTAHLTVAELPGTVALVLAGVLVGLAAARGMQTRRRDRR